jgi:hypothetical protein
MLLLNAVCIVVLAAVVTTATASGQQSAAKAAGKRSIPATPCSRTTLNHCPSSYFTGPLGKNNLIPERPGSFLIDSYGGENVSWASTMAHVLQREKDIHRKFDGIGIYYSGNHNWGSLYGMTDPTSYSPRREQWAHDHGSFPAISWTPDYTIGQINHGKADAIFTKAAKYWKTFNFTIMLRPFVEFDNPAAVYSAMPNAHNGNTNTCGAGFIAAWRRMVNIFHQNGATNVGFWWTPEEGYHRGCVNVSYPGDAYVDWTGSDWFNSCLVGNKNEYCTPLHSGWASFAQVFDYTALGSTAHSQQDLWGPRKPFVIGETGTWYDSKYPAVKGAWFRGIPAAAKKMLYLRGIMFYDVDVSSLEGPHNDFRVDYPTNTRSSYAGFKWMADNPWFRTGPVHP